MKKYFLLMLWIVCGLSFLTGCSDDDDFIKLEEARVGAACEPEEFIFRPGMDNVTTTIMVAIVGIFPASISIVLYVGPDSEVPASCITLQSNTLTIAKGHRSAEMSCVIKAEAVKAGAAVLKLELTSSDAQIATQKAEVDLYSTIMHYKGLNLKVNFTNLNWAAIELGEETIAGLFQTAVGIGDAPQAKRIHFDNYGQDIIGTTDGDLINITPLTEGTEIGPNSPSWVSNPYPSWEYMPVLYSKKYENWLGKTAYIGTKLGGCYFWFKLTATQNAEFTLTEFAYETEGNSIKAGQSSPNN